MQKTSALVLGIFLLNITYDASAAEQQLAVMAQRDVKKICEWHHFLESKITPAALQNQQNIGEIKQLIQESHKLSGHILIDDLIRGMVPSAIFNLSYKPESSEAAGQQLVVMAPQDIREVRVYSRLWDFFLNNRAVPVTVQNPQDIEKIKQLIQKDCGTLGLALSDDLMHRIHGIVPSAIFEFQRKPKPLNYLIIHHSDRDRVKILKQVWGKEKSAWKFILHKELSDAKKTVLKFKGVSVLKYIWG